MSTVGRPRVLITGATGLVGGKTLEILLGNTDVEIVAAVRSPEKAEPFAARGISTVILDYDKADTHLAALTGIDRLFIVTGYTVDMMRHSKSLVDNAKIAGVKHIVHLGACGRDDTTVAHWAWHQLVERYIEWGGFSFTHLRPEFFMQNVLNYGGAPSIYGGAIVQYIGDASPSWVDCDDVALVAAMVLSEPEKHNGQTYRLGYDSKSYYQIAEQLTAIVERPFRYEPAPPEVFFQAMKDAGAEMTYMTCVYEHLKMYAAHKIPGAEDTFDNFPTITGKQPTLWADFIRKHKAEFERMA